jgi:hypothetical protein
MNIVMIIVVFFTGFSLGYIAGRVSGYIDAKPKRDKTGRFVRED